MPFNTTRITSNVDKTRITQIHVHNTYKRYPYHYHDNRQYRTREPGPLSGQSTAVAPCRPGSTVAGAAADTVSDRDTKTEENAEGEDTDDDQADDDDDDDDDVEEVEDPRGPIKPSPPSSELQHVQSAPLEVMAPSDSNVILSVHQAILAWGYTHEQAK